MEAANHHATNPPNQLKLGAYKLREIARIEGVHYQTVLERKKRGVYVAVVTRSGKEAKESYRYLTAEASNAFRAIFASLGDPASVFCPEIPPEPEKPEAEPIQEIQEPDGGEETDTF